MTRLRTLAPMLAPANQRAAAAPRKTAEPHYQTPEHQRWRAEVIRRAGGMCQVCGEVRRLVADHIVELKDGGAPLDLANGSAKCWPCHSKKTAEARAARMRRPV
jgi:5-methylcytosine-specific restriction enzyme A